MLLVNEYLLVNQISHLNNKKTLDFSFLLFSFVLKPVHIKCVFNNKIGVEEILVLKKILLRHCTRSFQLAEITASIYYFKMISYIQFVV